MMERRLSGKARNSHCSLCSSSFYHKSDLARHIRSHVKEKLFTCSHCAYKTGDSSSLVRHVKAVHEQLIPFKCSFPGCNYSSTRNGNLERHRLIHDPDISVRRPFPCNFEDCEYRATQKSSLKSHIASKHNENRAKSFVCSLCSVAFHVKSVLDEHINGTHVKENIYGCNRCDFKSYYATHLRRHLKNVHGSYEKFDQQNNGRSSSDSSLFQSEEINASVNNVLPSDEDDVPGPEEMPSAVTVSTAATVSISDEVWGNSLCIFQCTLCHFIARKDEEEALKHSGVHKNHRTKPTLT